MSSPSSHVNFSAREYPAGKKIAGCYTLESQLFETPFAVVWSAQDDLLGRKVALYFLPDSVAADEKILNDLREQVRLNRQVLHPGIVRVYDLVEDMGCAAISLDLVDAKLIGEAQSQHAGGVFQPAELQKWCGQIIRTGAEAHEAHLIHRDLSPDTVLVRADGDILLSAFGISRTVLDALARQQPNRPDPHLPYLSPQLLDGEAPAPTDDIYSFGALLFTLLTGQPPFYKDDILPQIRKATPPTLAARRQELKVKGGDIPPAWEKAVAACLSKHTDARPKSFKEVGHLMGIEGLATPVAAAPVEKVAVEPTKGRSEKPPAGKVEKSDSKSSSNPIPPPASSIAALDSEKSATRQHDLERKQEKTSAVAAPPPSRISPFTPSGGTSDEYTERKRGGGIGIAAGLGVFALILIGLIYLASRQSVEPPTERSTNDLATADVTASPGGTPDPERLVRQLPTPLPSPTAKPVVAAVTPKAVPTATPAPAATAAAARIVPVEDPSALSAEALSQAIQKADVLFKQLTDQQTGLEATLETTRKTAEEGTKKLPEAQKELEAIKAAAGTQQETQRKAAAEAEEARKAAEAKQAAVDALKKKFDEQQAALKKQQGAIDQIKLEGEKAATNVKVAEAALEKLKVKVTEARAERKRLTDARTQLTARDAQTEAARQQQLEAERKAAAELAAKQEAERTALAAEAAEAETAAAEAAALAEQARQALEKAERLRKASEASRKRANAAASGAPVTSPTPAAPLPAPVPAVSPSAEVEPTPVATTAGPVPTDSVTNSLGMKFVPVGDVLFSLWPTRLQDYAQFAKATGRDDGRWKDPGFEQGPDHPVVYVTWLDAIAFCQWLTEKEQASGDLPTNRTYRLPTDLEWSVAVGLPAENGKSPEDRDMGISNVFPWGNAWPPPLNAGNYTGEETGSDVAIKGFKDGFVYTSPVGRFAPSAAGLYDLGGNVWEWCMDWWNSKQTSKVLRGASWYNGALKLSLLSSCRVRATPDSSTDNYGFRVVLSAIPKATAIP